MILGPVGGGAVEGVSDLHLLHLLHHAGHELVVDFGCHKQPPRRYAVLALHHIAVE